jgi:hypothetical protein
VTGKTLTGRRLWWVAGAALGAPLVLFHVWLLLARIARADFGALDLVRWGAAVAVVAALRELWRRGGAFATRKSIVLGVLVIALHLGGAAPPVDAVANADSIFLLPGSLAPIVATILLVTALLGRPELLAPRLRHARVGVVSVISARRAALAPSLFSRPPPF